MKKKTRIVGANGSVVVFDASTRLLWRERKQWRANLCCALFYYHRQQRCKVYATVFVRVCAYEQHTHERYVLRTESDLWLLLVLLLSFVCVRFAPLLLREKCVYLCRIRSAYAAAAADAAGPLPGGVFSLFADKYHSDYALLQRCANFLLYGAEHFSCTHGTSVCVFVCLCLYVSVSYISHFRKTL